jgi:probable H4MPT-linked C1 transfer pathway protein
MKCLALDIGGANLKYSDGRSVAGSKPFALWRYPERLTDELRAILNSVRKCDQFAVTMTGELADCFTTKSEGVTAILQSVRQAVEDRRIRVYLTDGRLVDPETAIGYPRLAAASNWHVLARFAGRYAASGAALLLDVGSTTCDVIPLVDGQPVPEGHDDTSRLLSGELVYTGIERSPVCAVAQLGVYRDRLCPLAQELFATMRDVYLILGDLPEAPRDCETADGRPATRRAAIGRLARMVCADTEQFTVEDATAMARALADLQVDQVAKAMSQVVEGMPAAPVRVILSGHGQFLARRVLAETQPDVEIVSLADELDAEAARAAPAHALATLVREGVLE